MRTARQRRCLVFRAYDVVSGLWLQADRTLGPETSAPVFTVRAEPTAGERLQIQSRAWALAGGVEAYVELEHNLDTLTHRLDAEIYDDPSFVAARTNADGTQRDVDEVTVLLAASRLRWPSVMGEAYREVRNMLDRLQLMAAWSVLAVDPPPGLRSLEDLDAAGPDVVQVLFNAMHLLNGNDAAGKARSSPS